jgi:D-alanyl-D-alanine carboxypeptidase
MSVMRTGARRGLRWGLLSLATVVALITVTADPADAARSRRKRASAPAYNPAYAAIVVDANSGKVLHATSADAIRHPASLTKIMTLYLLFERLESGKLTLDSQLQVSEHAADQSPTKLGLRQGSTIRVEDVIKGMVTRSANDAAVVVAENLAGSESEFARVMTRKAHALGMNRTVYRNASGLPDSAQVTTARDQAILGRAIQERFPRYYRYFSTRTFTYKGQQIGNHNRLLGKIEGVDGIKTGFIRASGFNLVTSVKRDGRYLVAVVLGGKSGAARDARMRSLITEHIQTASVRRTAPMVAEAPTAKPSGKSTDRYALASADGETMRPTPVPMARVAPSSGSSEPIRPVQVKTLSVRPGTGNQTASVGPLHLPSAPSAAVAETGKAQPTQPPVAHASILGMLSANAAASASDAQAEPEPSASAIAMASVAPAPVPAATPRPQARSGWGVQVGAFPAESEAHQRLTLAKTKAGRLLGSAEPFTETVQKGSTTLYRARFSGLDKQQAEAVCKYLKRNDVDCLAIKI